MKRESIRALACIVSAPARAQIVIELLRNPRVNSQSLYQKFLGWYSQVVGYAADSGETAKSYNYHKKQLEDAGLLTINDRPMLTSLGEKIAKFYVETIREINPPAIFPR